MWPDKGRIGVGALADIAAVDMAREEVITSGRLHSRARSRPREEDDRRTAAYIVREVCARRSPMVQGMAGHGRQVTDIQKMPQQIPERGPESC